MRPIYHACRSRILNLFLQWNILKTHFKGARNLLHEKDIFIILTKNTCTFWTQSILLARSNISSNLFGKVIGKWNSYCYLLHQRFWHPEGYINICKQSKVVSCGHRKLVLTLSYHCSHKGVAERIPIPSTKNALRIKTSSSLSTCIFREHWEFYTFNYIHYTYQPV